MPPGSLNVNVQASAHGIWCWGGWFVLSTHPNHWKKFKTLKFGGVGGWSCPGFEYFVHLRYFNYLDTICICLSCGTQQYLSFGTVEERTHFMSPQAGHLWLGKPKLCNTNLAFLKLQLQCFDPWLQKILTKSVGSQGAREVRELCFQLFLCDFFWQQLQQLKRDILSTIVTMRLLIYRIVWSYEAPLCFMFPCFQLLACLQGISYINVPLTQGSGAASPKTTDVQVRRREGQEIMLHADPWTFVKVPSWSTPRSNTK